MHIIIHLRAKDFFNMNDGKYDQISFAAAMGVRAATVGLWIDNTQGMSRANAIKLLKLFNAEFDDLLWIKKVKRPERAERRTPESERQRLLERVK